MVIEVRDGDFDESNFWEAAFKSMTEIVFRTILKRCFPNSHNPKQDYHNFTNANKTIIMTSPSNTTAGAVKQGLAEHQNYSTNEGKVPSKPEYIRAPSGYTPRFSNDKHHLIEIDLEDIADEDVMCGRANKGSTHPGNLEFLRVIKFHRRAYQEMGAQHGKKTRLRNFIVDKDFKGRFIGMDDEGIHYLLTEEKARTKVSQALREKSRSGQKM
jgi:hypothetical protein